MMNGYPPPILRNKPLPHSLHVGEIIGYRVWLPSLDELTSMAFQHSWPKKGAVVRAKNYDLVDILYDGGNYIGPPMDIQKLYDTLPYAEKLCALGDHVGTCKASCCYVGIHAWKTVEDAEKYIIDTNGHPYVIGTIWMWGEIIEHRNGYRSTYAAIRSIDRIVINKRQIFWKLLFRYPKRYLQSVNSTKAGYSLEYYKKEYEPC